MIPKIIHYCWFGKGEKSAQTVRCINSWHKFFPDYQFMEWTEDNCNITEIPYIQQAYKEKKYAFVSDYIRIKVLKEYGGIYFDTDYEVINSMDNILSIGRLVTGMESKESVLTAMIAAEKDNNIISEFLTMYKDRKFIDEKGCMDMTPINKGFSSILAKYGVNLSLNELQILESGIVIYPIDVLCGFDVENWHEKITDKTLGVHHMGNSWATPQMKKHIKRIQFLQRILGYERFDKLKLLFKR